MLLCLMPQKTSGAELSFFAAFTSIFSASALVLHLSSEIASQMDQLARFYTSITELESWGNYGCKIHTINQVELRQYVQWSGGQGTKPC